MVQSTGQNHSNEVLTRQQQQAATHPTTQAFLEEQCHVTLMISMAQQRVMDITPIAKTVSSPLL